jgi:hypothetical protein
MVSIQTKPGVKHPPKIMQNDCSERNNPPMALSPTESRRPGRMPWWEGWLEKQKLHGNMRIRRREPCVREGKGTCGVQVLWHMRKGIVKIGRSFPGRNTSGTYSGSKSASTKLYARVTTSVPAVCRDYCSIHGQPAVLPSDRSVKTTVANARPALMGLLRSPKDNGLHMPGDCAICRTKQTRCAGSTSRNRTIPKSADHSVSRPCFRERYKRW